MQDEVLEGQISVDGLFGKMLQGLSAAPVEMISEPCWKSLQGSQNQEFLFLDLRKDGRKQDVSAEMDGLLHGDCTMLSTGVFPNVDRESHLSQILEEAPHPKYCLSPKACQGVLDRAERRGKILPEELKEALEYQVQHYEEIVSVMEEQYLFRKDLENQGGGKGILIQVDRVGTLSTTNNQSVLAALEGNGCRPSHKGDGYHTEDVSYTLNATERHCVAVCKLDGADGGNKSFAIVGDHENRPTDMTTVVVERYESICNG